VLAWTDKTFTNEYTRASRIIPVIGETYDGGLSDVWSMPLSRQNVIDALNSAAPGPVAEGSVGGGTGMVCFYFKCGIGTSSRLVPFGPENFTVGVLVQANNGQRNQLVLAGKPVGKEISDLMPRRASEVQALREGDGSLIVVIATDAPLLPSQLQRLARRAAVGMARTGATGTTSSGDIFLAFSTATPITVGVPEFKSIGSVPNEFLDPLLEAAAFATEEAIVNALVAGEDMAGRGGSFVYGMPEDRVAAMFSGKDK
jgi:L-aminopeptidase/D-esterase-like protein